MIKPLLLGKKIKKFINTEQKVVDISSISPVCFKRKHTTPLEKTMVLCETMNTQRSSGGSSAGSSADELTLTSWAGGQTVDIPLPFLFFDDEDDDDDVEEDDFDDMEDDFDDDFEDDDFDDDDDDDEEFEDEEDDFDYEEDVDYDDFDE